MLLGEGLIGVCEVLPLTVVVVGLGCGDGYEVVVGVSVDGVRPLEVVCAPVAEIVTYSGCEGKLLDRLEVEGG